MIEHYLQERDNAFRQEMFDRRDIGARAIIENGLRQVIGLPGRLVSPVLGLALSGAYDVISGRHGEQKRIKEHNIWVENNRPYYESNQIPAPPLVGVETNPGPTKKASLRTQPQTKEIDYIFMDDKGTQINAKPRKKKMKVGMVSTQTKSEKRDSQAQLAPVAFGSSYKTTPDKVSKVGPDITRHSGSELVTGSISGNTSFQVAQSYALNPGNSNLFPRLSSLAALFTQYRFCKLTFRWVPVVSTATAGDIMLIVDTDASNQPPTTENQAVDHEGAVATSCWERLNYNVSVKSLHSVHPYNYVRVASMPGDIKNYDVGNLFVCTNNQSGTGAIGKLFVDYVVDLKAPILINNQGLKSSTVAIWYNSNAQSLSTGVTASAAFNQNPTGNAVGVTLAANTTDFTCPTGLWRIQGRATFKDTSNETFLAGIGISVNGTPLTTGSSGYINYTSLAGGYITLDCDYVTAINSSSGVVNLSLEATGAAGTLTCIAQSVWICFTAI